MDFSLSDEQRQLQDGAARFVRQQYSFEQYRHIVRSDEGWSSDNWRQMAELGWLSIPVPEEYGGLGCSPVETMVLMEEFGRGLVPEPYLVTVVMGAQLLVNAGTQEQREQLLPLIAEGNLKLAFAVAEADSRFDLGCVAVRAQRDGSDYRLNGKKIAVLHASCAEKLFVTARTASDDRNTQGVTIFIIDSNQEGVDRTDYRTIDGRPASNIEFRNVRAPASAIVGDLDNGVPTVTSAIDHGIGALAAESVGCMDVLIDATNEYVKTRKQFGVPIGSFQVLQHRLVDMVIAREHARSITYMLTAKLSHGDIDVHAAAAATKAAIGQRGRLVGGQAVHLHGGIGMTDELPIGDYFKRLMMIDITFGDANHHRAEFARAIDNHAASEDKYTSSRVA